MPQPEGFNPPVREGGRLSRSPNWRTLMTGFSPRSHEGSDTPKTTMTAITISFNPRSHEGSDFLFGMMQGKLSVFQSTLPRGERPYMGRLYRLCLQVSIHAPTRGATLMKTNHSHFWRFQSTLPRGERRWIIRSSM